MPDRPTGRLAIGSFRRVLVVLAGAAALLAVGGVALAQAVIPNPETGQIHACYLSNGDAQQVDQVRLVGGADDCRPGETAISWSQEGPQGPQGPQGDQGPQGAMPGARRDRPDRRAIPA